MAEKWSSWGDTGPVIGISASVSSGKTSATVSFSFMYCRRYNYASYGYTQSFSTTATAYVGGSYYDDVSFKPFSNSDFTEGEDTTLIYGSKSYTKNSSSYTVTLKFVCSGWGGAQWNNIKGDSDTSAKEVSLTVTIPAISKVNTPTISTSSSIRIPSQNSFTVSWNSVSNASGYYVTLSDSSGTYSESASVNTTSKTFTVSNLANYRGNTFTAYVQALGSGNYGDSNTASKTIATINSLPGYPQVTRQTSTSLTTQNSISFTVAAGEDADGHSTSLYYSFDGGVTKELFTSPLTITHETTTGGGIISGSNTISFYTYDGYEYSTATSKTFTATFAPVVGGIVTTHTPVENMNGNSTILTSETKITFSMSSGAAKSILLYVRSGTSSTLSGNGSLVSNDYYSYNETTGTITIPIVGISTSLIAEGNYFQFAFKVSDGTAESNLSDWQTYKRRPKAPILPTYNSYSNHADSSYGATATNTFYKNYVTINFTNPNADAACAKISSMAVVATYGSGLKEYACSTSSGTASVKMDLAQVNPGTSTTFKFKVVDAAGQTKTSSNVLTLTKTSNLVYGGSTVNVTNDNLKPMTNTLDFQIAHPIAQATGTPIIIYKYYMQIGSTKKEITTYTSTKETDQIKILITAANINALALSLVTDTNIAYDTVITVLAADGFATTATLTKTIKVNFTEPPSFLSSTFKIKHDYYTNRSSITTSTGVDVPAVTATNWTSVRDKVMVNSGEGIIFVLPKATDPNDDISEYRIFLARNDFIDTSSVLSKDEVTFGQTPWLTIPYTTLTKGTSDTNYYYYLFKASQYTKNEYFYFKLQARDATGNVSSEIICPNYIVGCRTVSPTFSAGNVRVDRVGTDVTLTYNFQITDLGGSAKSSGWDKTYYSYCPNFERTISGYTPKATLQVEIAPDQSFTTDVISASLVTFTPGDGEGLINFTHTQTKLSGFATSHAKIFMRFTLVVSYGLQNSSTLATVTSVPQVYTYFGAVPTVAHRAHKVGINTNALGQDDVLVVENYQGTRYVRFKGTDASNASQTYEITFDLLNGTITGAVINCGEW